MSCYHPLPAYRQAGSTFIGDYRLHKDAAPTKLPCGTCLGCVTDKARGWALRCTLELHNHNEAVMSTLTYSDENLPFTLQKPHISQFLKRLRKCFPHRRIKFFACGEYGETTLRPHYHAILYGLDMDDTDKIEHTWQHGHVRTDTITPARIAYVAGYVQKKIDYKHDRSEWIDTETGELKEWQPPFIHMSRRPGIGADARKFIHSWRSHAVLNGIKIPVPKYLHDAWKHHATPADIEELEHERFKLALERDNSKARIEAKEQIAIKQHEIRAQRRKY